MKNATTEVSTIRLKLLDLDKKKERIESEISAFSDVLKSQNVGLTEGSLVDREGYPRNDIDIYQVREARQRIICLQNDHKALMKAIEEGLYALHAKTPFHPAVGESSDILKSAQNMKSIAKIDRIEAGSPAEKANLQVGDYVIKFGSVTETNFKGLQDFAAVVKHSIDQPLTVIIKREEEFSLLKLTPKTWAGKGFLGCNIIPLK